MRKKISGLWALAGAIMFLLGTLGEPEEGTAGTGDSVLMAGSTSMQTYVSALAEGYMNTYPDKVITAEFTGTGAGIEAVLCGTADIGNASRYIREEEKSQGAVENLVAMDGIAVCVDSSNTVTGLTSQQLIDIYMGAVTNWAQLGGEDVPIVVVGREAGSGTRIAFEELLGISDKCAYVNELDSSGAVLARVAATPGAIGYVSLDVLNDTVIGLQLDGAAPTAENIRAGTYFLCRPFIMVTRGGISEQSESVQSWFSYVLGKEGQEIAASVGLVIME